VPDRVDILIADDERVNLILVEGILRSPDINILQASSGQETLELVAKHDIALLLLDIMMPDMDGFKVAEKLRANEATQHIPIIFITAISKDQRQVFKGYELGAVDYLFKPVEPDILKSKVSVFVELKKQRQALEETAKELEITVARLRKSEEALHYHAMHDQVTGMSNRLLCLDRIGRAVERSLRRDDYFFAVAFLNLDRFKMVNESMGHAFGDRVLTAAGQRLAESTRRLDTVSRFGSDEFVILMEELQSPREAVRIAKRFRDAFSRPLSVDSREIPMTVCLGLALGGKGYPEADDLLRNAAIAMRRAKVSGGDRIKIFNETMLEEAVQLMTIENDLRRALANKELFLVYQPIVTLDDFRLRGFEALVRWRHPEKGLIRPSQFIPVAEDSGIIHKLGQWVLYQACATMAAWTASIPHARRLTISVNISGRQFSQGDIVDLIHRTIETTRLEPENLKLEITETAIMEKAEVSAERLLRLKNLGIKLSIDDFGTGYSSMSYLQRFPLDTLKIDLSFVKMLETSSENREIVRAIINLAHSLRLKTVAEGVETEEQKELLRGLDCDYAQGYLFSRPISEEAAKDFIEAAHC